MREIAWKSCAFSYVALALRSVPDEKIILEVLKIIGLLTSHQRDKVVGMSMTVMDFSYIVVGVLNIGLNRCLN